MLKIFSDADVIRRYRAGDKDAFREIVKRYKKFAYTYFFRSFGSHQDAEDLSQEAFIRVLKELDKGKLDEQESIANRFKKIVENLAVDHDRRKKSDEVHEVLQADVAEVPEPEIPASDGSDAQLDFRELRYEVGRAIRKLPPALRGPAMLNILYEYKPQEIAKSCNLDVRVVWDRLGRARKALRIALAHHEKGQDNGNRRLGQAASGAARPTDGAAAGLRGEALGKTAAGAPRGEADADRAARAHPLLDGGSGGGDLRGGVPRVSAGPGAGAGGDDQAARFCAGCERGEDHACRGAGGTTGSAEG